MADCFSLPNAVELVEELRSDTHFRFGDFEGGFAAPTEKELKAADAIERLVSKCNQLAEENAKLKAERDAAVADLEIAEACITCKYDDDVHADCIGYEWRGVNHD